jgi:hypothetical protein
MVLATTKDAKGAVMDKVITMYLTREQIMSEPAGEQLDAWVAEYIMGWTYYGEDKELWTNRDSWYFYVGIDDCFSTDIATAWQIIDKYLPDWWPELICEDGVTWKCLLGWPKSEPSVARADTPMLAICKAALLAVLDAQ